MLKFIKIPCVLRQKSLSAKFLIFVILIFGLRLNAHQCLAASTSSRSVAYAKAQAAKRTGGNNGGASYFRQDPYGPNTYAFGYEVNDNRTSNIQFRDERRYVNGSVEGSFGHVRPDGRVTVTHFLADKERGFVHNTQTFEPGEQQKWQAHWPTKRPDIQMERPQDMATGTVVYDNDLHLNVTSAQTPDQLAAALQQQHGIDVNPVDLQKDIIDSAVQDIIGGKVPLQQLPGKQQTQVGFDTVHEFIPPDFPIIPFQLPPLLNESIGNARAKPEADIKEMREGAVKLRTQKQKQLENPEQAETNNAAKEISVSKLDDNGLTMPKSTGSDKVPQNSPLPLVESPSAQNEVDRRAWYEQIIDETRNDFLENQPN